MKADVDRWWTWTHSPPEMERKSADGRQRWRESQLWNLLPNFKISACSWLLGRVHSARYCAESARIPDSSRIVCIKYHPEHRIAFDLKTDVETGTVRKDLLKECVMVKTYSTKTHSPKCLFYRFVLPWRAMLIEGRYEHIHRQRWSGSLLMAVRGGEKVSCGIFFPTSRFRLVHDYLVEFKQLATAQSRLEFQTVVGLFA